MNIPAGMLPHMNAYDFSDVLYKAFYDPETAPKAYMFLGARRSFVKDFIRKNEAAFRDYLQKIRVHPAYAEELIANMKKYGKTSNIYVIDHDKGVKLLNKYKQKGILPAGTVISPKLSAQQIELIRNRGEYYQIALLDENGHPLENVLVDRNGDGQISDADRYVTGKSILPKFYFGISTQFTYKKWDFGFNAHGSLGGYALNKATKKDFATSYSDDHTKGYIDNLGTYALETGWTESMTEFQNYSDLFLENASFFRMDNINVGYTFDEFKKWKGNIRVGASVQNVFTITKYSGLDPEITSADGVDNNLIPRPRLYTLRLNINF